jgi:FkbM family methyltransferase
MSIPDFVEEYKGYWLLKNDQSISMQVKKFGKLGYDKDFIDLPELNAMPKKTLCIDVGAFIGDTSRIFLDKGFSVLAWEPQGDAVQCLRHNCPEATTIHSPVGDGRSVQIYHSEGGNMGGRPVLEGGDRISAKLDQHYKNFIKDNECIFLKLDAEGFEPAILEGAKELLSNPALKHIVCEFNPNALASFGYTCDDILKYLADWDYREIFRYYDQNWDCVFTRKP